MNDKKRDIITPPSSAPQQSSTSTNGIPELLATFETHTDAVTSIKLIERNGKVLLLSASTDCSVAIHSLDALIGIFGQSEHWNINDIAPVDIGEWVAKRRETILNQTHDTEEDVDEEDISLEEDVFEIVVPSIPFKAEQQGAFVPVSYTHLTLPTILLV